MSNIIMINNMTIKVKDEQLLHIKKASVEKGSVIGLVGANGSGKSTLLNYLVGKSTMDDISVTGEVIRKVAKMGYYQQEVSSYNKEILSVDYELVSQHNLSGWKKDQDFENMSGGERGKQRLLDIFSEKVELLVLDEPTNHLDRESIGVLQTLIERFNGTVIMVSHDRAFIERTCTAIWEIDNKELTCFRGSLSQYEEECDRKLREQEKAHDKNIKEQKRIEKELQALKNWSASAHAQSTKQEFPKEYYRSKAKRMDSQRKSAEKRLGKKLKDYQTIEIKKVQPIVFDFGDAAFKTGTAFLLDNVSKRYDGEQILDKLSLTINFGDKLLVKGNNGSGKTTLLKVLTDEISYEGNCWVSEFAKVGYLKQEILDLPTGLSIEDYIDVTAEDRGRFILLANQLGFSLAQLQQKIKTLSMGERLKVKLLYFMMRDVNVLILDEPTNHLDFPSRQALEKVLMSYPGTVIFTSHDEHFAKCVSTRSIVLGKKFCENEKQEKCPDNNSKLVLEMEKDRLMSELSFLSPSDDEYRTKNERFIEVVQTLKAYN